MVNESESLKKLYKGVLGVIDSDLKHIPEKNRPKLAREVVDWIGTHKKKMPVKVFHQMCDKYKGGMKIWKESM